VSVRRIDPLTWNVPIVDPATGLPSNEFMRKWAAQHTTITTINNLQTHLAAFKGAVTSVGLTLDSGLYSVTGSPVKQTGTLTGTLNTQSANLVFAGPSSGAAAKPTFRALVPADLPNSGPGSGTVTSVGLALDSGLYTVSGSPVTGAGTLTGTLNTQSANLVYAGPTSGGATKPSFRALVSADLPGGGAAPGGWANVAFGASGTYFTQTMYPSTVTFSLAAGQRLEILAEVYTSGVNSSQVLVSSDGTNGYVLTVQSDNNSVVYWNNGGTFHALGVARGVNTDNNWKGLHRYDCSFSVHAASNNRLTCRIENWRFNGDNDFLDTNVNLVGSATIYLLTDDITKCSVQARVLG